jgi:flagellar biogenesis protein FliO
VKSGNVSEEVLTLSTIASMILGPKQKLLLIQVGDEKILIAIGPESTNFITMIGVSKAVFVQVMVAAFFNGMFAGYQM